jgi:phosphatidylinositol glycan class Z
MKAENIALHGIHPWYLHYTVNMAILLGPIYLYWVVSNLFFAGLLKMERLFFGSLVLFPLSMLSLNSHQEPRFLLPLAIPVILQVSRHVRSKAILALWIVFNIALTILFGLAHQGGVIPTISVLSSPHKTTSTSLYFYKTYMPPRYLLANTGESLRVPDLVGMDLEAVRKLLAEDDSSRKLLITPQSFATDFGHVQPVSSYFPHLDLDNFRLLNSWRDTLSLSVYEIHTDSPRSK